MQAWISWLCPDSRPLALLLPLLWTTVGEVVTIDGTEFPEGTSIDDEFSSVGVLFDSGLGYVTFATDDFTGIFGTAPDSTWAGVDGASISAPIHATFIAPGNSLVPGIVNGTIAHGSAMAAATSIRCACGHSISTSNLSTRSLAR